MVLNVEHSENFITLCKRKLECPDGKVNSKNMFDKEMK